MTARIDFLDSSSFLEGEVIEDAETYIVIDDDMFGVCKVFKDDNIVISGDPPTLVSPISLL